MVEKKISYKDIILLQITSIIIIIIIIMWKCLFCYMNFNGVIMPISKYMKLLNMLIFVIVILFCELHLI
jgi:hypothetical protein